MKYYYPDWDDMKGILSLPLTHSDHCERCSSTARLPRLLRVKENSRVYLVRCILHNMTFNQHGCKESATVSTYCMWFQPLSFSRDPVARNVSISQKVRTAAGGGGVVCQSSAKSIQDLPCCTVLVMYPKQNEQCPSLDMLSQCPATRR